MPGLGLNPAHDIVDTLLDESSFRVLISALQTVDMVDELKAAGPFTLFAPSDEAFAKLPPGAVTELEKPVNTARLRSLLRRHIVCNRLLERDVETRLVLEPLEGPPIRVEADGTGIKVGPAKILGSAIPCTNGVIHVLDSVLPPA